MRNLKRALSLALASVMLLGMMVVGSSAAFADADEIVNTEAVEITAGLKIFEGSDGKFNPKGTVTRAQMATVIVKMLYGSEINADQFKGTGKFSDTAAFEGGWAEGYINLCASLGIVKGYGDGTFKPGQAVNTAEAATMIINALGVDAGEGTWPMTVMAAVEEIELFEDMEGAKPGTYAEMTRDQLAVAVWNGLNYSAEGVQGYKVSGSDIVFKTWSDAVEYYKAGNGDSATGAIDNIFEVKNDTLAETVFEIETATGYITANQATGEDYTVVADKNVNLETGLDQLGHYVTVYYKDTYRNEKNPGTAYCVVEQAEYVKVAKDITADKKDYLAAFGTKVEDETTPVLFDAKGYKAGETGYSAPTYKYDETTYTADAGTYVIENETGKIIAYISGITTTLDTVSRVTTTAGKESIRLSNTLYQNNEDTDEIVEYADVAEDDIVIVKTYRDTLTYITKPEVVTGKITKTGTVDGDAATYIDGKAYVNGSWGLASTDLTGWDGSVYSYTPDADKTYDAYIVNGKLAGVKLVSGAANLSEVVYVVEDFDTTDAGNYGSKTKSYYVQGVNAAGEEVSILVGIAGCSEDCDDTCVDADGAKTNTCTHVVDTLTANKFYAFEKSTDKKQAKKDVMVAEEAKNAVNVDPTKVFDVDVDEFFAEDVTGTVNANELKKDDKYVTTAAGRVYLTENTKFVVIDSTTTGDKLDVATYTGSIAKDITSDTLTVAATEDENGNYYAEMIVIVGGLELNTEDYIYVSTAAAADASTVEGGYEIVAYFSATNSFETIVADDDTAGFYTNYTIDEDGVYELNGNDVSEGTYIKETEEAAAVIGTAINSDALDLYNAADAAIVDVRAEDVLEDSEVAAIESLKDIQSALKAGYKVFFDAIVNPDGAEDVVTHIFVYSVQVEELDADGNSYSPERWVEA